MRRDRSPSAGDEGHVYAVVRGPQHRIRPAAQSCGLWGWDPAPPSEDPRLPAGLKSGGQQVKTQALDTPLSLLLQARAAAAVSTQRVQTHPVHPSGCSHLIPILDSLLNICTSPYSSLFH